MTARVRLRANILSRLSPGDVVLLRSPRHPEKTGARVDPLRTGPDRRTKLGHESATVRDGQVADLELWYGLVRYFFEEDKDDPDLQVHVIW